MSSKEQLKSMFGKLNEMNTFLGGDALKKSRRGANQFQMIKNEFLEKRHEVQKMLEQRDNPNGDKTRLGRLTYKIREGITEMNQILDRMQAEQQAGHRNGTSSDILAKQQKIIDNCKSLLQQIRNRHLGLNSRPNQHQIQTLTEMKAKLLKQIDTNAQQIQMMDSSQHLAAEQHDEQVKAMDEFKETDKQIDVKVDDLIMGIMNLNRHVKKINEANDVVQEKVQKNRKAVEQLSLKIETENQKLKKIIQKFKPHNCCLWIVLFLSIAGLVVIIVNIARNHNN